MDPKLFCALILVAFFVSCYAAELPARERRGFSYSDYHSIVKRQPSGGSMPSSEGGMMPSGGLAALGPEITEMVQQCVDEILASKIKKFYQK
uniref:Uncharacterized protein n=1 Tax=Rhodnius prolixus TaxID=13249 RepID=T1ICL9_RHOPR